MSGDYNMSIRKFLKQVGVTSQQVIEEGLRNADGAGPHEVKMVLCIDGLEIEHVVTGTLRSDGE
ncbi:MAG: DUF6494 family protein [Rhodobacteraceae bacterium]|nr:DUF6494 family protein [Paracoccaceae bacterium]